MLENRSAKTIRQGEDLPSNFRTSALKERPSVPAVAMAVFSGSVSCSTVGKLNEKVSAMFENRSVKNYTPRRRLPFQFPNIGAERTPVGARCRRGHVLRARILLYSGSIEGLYERDVQKSK
jgi:hypothetical protein